MHRVAVGQRDDIDAGLGGDTRQTNQSQDWKMTNEQGAEVGEGFHPFERVGIYVPGGTAPLVSTAIMTVAIAVAGFCGSPFQPRYASVVFDSTVMLAAGPIATCPNAILPAKAKVEG